MPNVSMNSCEFHQRNWRSHMNALRTDTGIPEGLRISIGGNMMIASEMGGKMVIEYETMRLKENEAFLVFIDS